MLVPEPNFSLDTQFIKYSIQEIFNQLVSASKIIISRFQKFKILSLKMISHFLEPLVESPMGYKLLSVINFHKTYLVTDDKTRSAAQFFWRYKRSSSTSGTTSWWNNRSPPAWNWRNVFADLDLRSFRCFDLRCLDFRFLNLWYFGLFENEKLF